jgi:hypothetical protein
MAPRFYNALPENYAEIREAIREYLRETGETRPGEAIRYVTEHLKPDYIPNREQNPVKLAFEKGVSDGEIVVAKKDKKTWVVSLAP